MSHLYKCDNLHLNKKGNAAPSFNSSFHLCQLIEAFSQGNFCFSQPSFPCLIRNRSVFLWLNSPNSPRGETWNKIINYFKTKILSSLGIKLESENEKHRRSLAELRCFTEFSPWQFSLFRFQPCLTLVSLLNVGEKLIAGGEIRHQSSRCIAIFIKDLQTAKRSDCNYIV